MKGPESINFDANEKKDEGAGEFDLLSLGEKERIAIKKLMEQERTPGAQELKNVFIRGTLNELAIIKLLAEKKALGSAVAQFIIRYTKYVAAGLVCEMYNADVFAVIAVFGGLTKSMFDTEDYLEDDREDNIRQLENKIERKKRAR